MKGSATELFIQYIIYENYLRLTIYHSILLTGIKVGGTEENSRHRSDDAPGYT